MNNAMLVKPISHY